MVVMGEAVALLQLRSAGGMAFAMANAEVLAHEGAVAIGKITAKDLFRGVCEWNARNWLVLLHWLLLQRSHTVQLMPVQVLGTRITLATALMCAFEFAIRGGSPTASSALGGLFVGLGHAVWFNRGEHHRVP